MFSVFASCNTQLVADNGSMMVARDDVKKLLTAIVSVCHVFIAASPSYTRLQQYILQYIMYIHVL